MNDWSQWLNHLGSCLSPSRNFEDFKAVMLASLRSLIPKGWSPQHEAAWTWLWDHVESLVQAQIGRIPQREKMLANFFASLDDESRMSVTWALYGKFFELVPAGREVTTYRTPVPLVTLRFLMFLEFKLLQAEIVRSRVLQAISFPAGHDCEPRLGDVPGSLQISLPDGG